MKRAGIGVMREEARAGMGVTEEGSAQERAIECFVDFSFSFSVEKKRKTKVVVSAVFEKKVSVDFIFHINRTDEKSKSMENIFLRLF
jgi:hypothetical protein